MFMASKTLYPDEVLTGYKIVRNGITLEVKEYSRGKMWCYCSLCGYVIPTLDNYIRKILRIGLSSYIIIS